MRGPSPGPQWPLLFVAVLMGGVVVGRNLVVTEIAFDGTEFLEFQNISEAPLDLQGYTVFGGIDAFLTGVLQPGEVAVIVELEREFRGDYGDSPRILAEFQRKLDNDGESIGVRDAAGKTILEFGYQTAGPGWPRVPASAPGTPLELIHPHDPTVNLSLGVSWRRAYRWDGSPGKETDGDRDGLDDAWEHRYFRGLERGSEDDPDRDGLDNGTERRLLTDPTSADTDGDGLSDAHETMTGVFVAADNTGTDPLQRDSDADGLRDGLEVPSGPLGAGRYRTDPNKADTDGDSFSDGDEVFYLGDPLNPEAGPRAPQILSLTCEPAKPRAGESFTLHWEIQGSASRSLQPLPDGARELHDSSTSKTLLPMARNRLIHEGSVWKFEHSDTDYGTAWRGPGFDDSSWQAALAPFGGFPPWFRPDLGWFTELPAKLGGAVPYFRQAFPLPDRIPGNALLASYFVSGGGCLYFDGRLVQNVGMPESYNRQSYASENRFPGTAAAFDPDPLGPGPLVVAAESHLGPGENYALYFDLSLDCFKPLPGLHTYVLSAVNPYGEAEREIELAIADDLPPMRTYSEWAEGAIPDDGPLGVEARLATIDLDGDGLANLLEFLAGGDPLRWEALPLTVEPVFYGAGSTAEGKVSHFLVSYRRYRNPANAGLRLEWSVDGTSWVSLPSVFDNAEPHALSIRTIDDECELVTCRISPYPWRKPKLFRLRGVNAEQ